MWDTTVDQEGWRAPGDDMGAGGDSRLDVYLRHLDYNGYAHAEWHDDHWAAYLEVDPAVANLGGEVLASVAGHELHHAIEYSYSVETHTWVHEASATYAQYRLFHETAAMVAAVQLLWGLRLDAPEVGLDATGDRMEYAAFVWVKYLVDVTGSVETPRIWWEIIADEPDWRWSLEELALELGEQDALALFEEYAEWLFFSCEADDGQHWLDDGLGCQLEIGARITQDSDGLPAQWPLDGPAHFGAVYATVELAGDEPLTVECQGPQDGDWAMRAVALEAGVARSHRSARGTAGGTAALQIHDLAGADELLVLVANATAAPGAPYECEVREFAVEDVEDDGCACTAAGDAGGGVPAGVLLALMATARRLIGRRRRS
jgi:MYXO-CTERM domain-containing protein